MQYMLLIHSSEDGWNALSEAEQDEMYAGYGAFTQAIKAKGAFLAGDQLAERERRHHRPRPRRRDARHRRPVRRDEGAARRLLPGRGRVDRRGDRVGRADPGRALRRDRGAPGRAAVGRGGRIDELERVFRDERGRVLASLIRVLGDFELAEDAVQDAFAAALERWPRAGIPANPGAWIQTVARNAAIDRIRRAPDARAQDRAARARRGGRGGGRGDAARRTARADLHLLPPGARASTRRSR